MKCHLWWWCSVCSMESRGSPGWWKFQQHGWMVFKVIFGIDNPADRGEKWQRSWKIMCRLLWAWPGRGDTCHLCPHFIGQNSVIWLHLDQREAGRGLSEWELHAVRFWHSALRVAPWKWQVLFLEKDLSKASQGWADSRENVCWLPSGKQAVTDWKIYCNLGD